MTLKPIDYRLRWERANIPVQHRGQTLSTFDPYDDDTRRAKAAAITFVENFPTLLGVNGVHAGRGLLLPGNPGTGKTSLMCRILTEIHLRWDRDIRFLAFANYISALTRGIRLSQLIDVFRDAYTAAELTAIEAACTAVRFRPLIGIDDIGKEHRTSTGYAQNVFDQLLRDRYRDGLPCIATSNCTPREWEELYGPSMRSFVNEAFQVCVFTGPDQRVTRTA